MSKFLLSVLLLAATLHAQTAKVIELSPEDAALAKSFHDQKEALDKKIADFNDGIKKHYLLETKKSDGLTWTICTRSPCTSYKDGWGYGSFEFSDDFKFIVPTRLTPSTSSNAFTCPTFTYGGNTLTDGRNWFVAN